MTVKFAGTREIPLTDLQRFPGNAHQGDGEAIGASLRRSGQYRALIVRELDDGGLVVLAGNNVADALQTAGHETARCEVIRCSDSEATRINVADNRLAALGDDNPHLLLKALNSLGGDFEGSGFAEQEADALRRALEAAPEPAFAVPPDPPPGHDPEIRPTTPAFPDRPAQDYGPVPAPPGEHARPVPVPGGVAEVILVVTQEQRDECIRLIGVARGRDGDQPAARIILAAMRAHAQD